MSGAYRPFAWAAVMGLFLAGCASEDKVVSIPEANVVSIPAGKENAGSISLPARPLQCVPYARAKSGIPIFGDAYTWWASAAGKFQRSRQPREGAVMVLTSYAGRHRAHLAVVREVVDARQITVDHANWLDDGAIYQNDPVIDVSSDNDWSEVRIWNIRMHTWGSRMYPVRGFIGPGPDKPQPEAGAVISMN